MSEHHKYEQPGGSLPPGLEYKPEYWDAALQQIEARERFLFWRNFGFAALGVLLLVFSSGAWYYLEDSGGDSIAELRNIELVKQIGKSTIVDNNSSRFNSDPFDASSSDYVNAGINSTIEDSVVELENENLAVNTISDDNTNVVDDNTKEINSTRIEISKAGDENTRAEAEANSGNDHQEIDEPTLSGSFAINEENRITLSMEEQLVSSVPIPLGGAATTSEDTIVPHFLRRNASASNLLTEFNHQKELGNIKLQPILVASIDTHDEYRGPKGKLMEIKPYGLSLPLKQFNVQLIAGTSFITHYGSRTKDKQVNPMLGLGVDYNMTKRWSFNTNLHYFSVKNILRPYQSVQTDYDFIFRTTTTTVETYKLHYLSLPLNLAYRIGERHQLSVGAGLSLLVQGDNLITVNQTDNFTKTLLDEYTTKGYINGFETFNTYLNFGYNIYLTGNVTAGILYQHGLTDVTIDNYFEESNNDRNKRVSAYLRFNIH